MLLHYMRVCGETGGQICVYMRGGWEFGGRFEERAHGGMVFCAYVVFYIPT